MANTYLGWVNLSRAWVHGTRFNGARMLGTNLTSLDLSEALGLATVTHRGPTAVGVDTIYLSKGRIPPEFLRGCGVPQDLIDLIPSLVTDSPIHFYSCFISYSSEDDEFARRLHGRMQQERLRVWFAPEDMKGGRKIYDQIDQAIRIHDKLLLVLSPASMASDWVATEIERTRAAEKEQGEQKLFPIRICPWEDVASWTVLDADSGRDLAKKVRSYHIPDFSNWKDHDAFEAAFGKLMEDLKAEG